jgi:hypothetical protein
VSSHVEHVCTGVRNGLLVGGGCVAEGIAPVGDMAAVRRCTGVCESARPAARNLDRLFASSSVSNALGSARVFVLRGTIFLGFSACGVCISTDPLPSRLMHADSRIMNYQNYLIHIYYLILTLIGNGFLSNPEWGCVLVA